MTEPTRAYGAQNIVISPDNPDFRRVWPDPRAPFAEPDDRHSLVWRATYAPESVTQDEVRQLVRIATAYAHIFETSQRGFRPTHAAIRAHLREGTK